MITGIDRVNALNSGELVDRIPVFCTLLDQGPKELGMSPEVYYSKGEYVAEAQLKMREKYGYDNVWSLFYVGREAELLGCKKVLYAREGSPNVADFVIKTYDDIPKLQVPENLADHPAFEEPMKCQRILKDEVGGKYSICAYLTSTMTLPALLMGMDNWMDLLFSGPADLKDLLLGKCHDFFIKELTAYRNAGADVLVYSNPFGSTDIVPMKFFLNHALPWIEKDVKAVGPEGLVYYCGTSRMNNIIDIVLEKTGIGCFNLSPVDDIAEASKTIAGRAITVGIFNDIKLIDWSEKEIKSEVRRIIREGMPAGKFIFGTQGMPCGIPEKNIRAMLDAAYELGSHAKKL